ncbi:hypothetical protein FKP32DRAFT_1559582, partial [Trametes sanguinea]
MRKTRNARLIRWDEFISKFRAEFEHIPGTENKVADCLSRYFENDHPEEIHPVQTYVNADVRLEPDTSELTKLRQAELDEIVRIFALRERVETREEEARPMAAAQSDEPLRSPSQSPITVRDALTAGPPLESRVRDTSGFDEAVKRHYVEDTTFGKVLKNVAAYPTFALRDG